MKKTIIILIFLGLSLNATELKYGERDNELKIGDGLKGIVNDRNAFVFAPWSKDVGKDVKWGKYRVEFKKLLSLRDKPYRYDVILAVCEPINKEDPKISWIYRDDWQDDHIYSKLILQDGKFLIAYKIDPKDKSISVESIKK